MVEWEGRANRVGCGGGGHRAVSYDGGDGFYGGGVDNVGGDEGAEDGGDGE